MASIIRDHCKNADLCQLQLAEMAGVGKTAVFDVEKAKETVQLDTLKITIAFTNKSNYFKIAPIRKCSNLLLECMYPQS
jgi:HTH-type transcriptional regulator / antitoxin HipB